MYDSHNFKIFFVESYECVDALKLFKLILSQKLSDELYSKQSEIKSNTQIRMPSMKYFSFTQGWTLTSQKVNISLTF